MGRHDRPLLALALAFLALVRPGHAGLELFSAGKPVFVRDSSLALLDSDLLKANLAAELGKLAGDFRDHYAGGGIQQSGYSDVNLRRLADAVSRAADKEISDEEELDAGSCRKGGDKAAGELGLQEKDSETGLSGVNAESVDTEKQLDFLSNCSRASKIDVVFLGDEVMQRWDTESFQAMCDKVGGVCANFGIEGQNVGSMMGHLRRLVSATCLSPKAWVMVAGTHQLVESGGRATSAVANGISAAAESIRRASCHADVVVVGMPPVDVNKLVAPQGTELPLLQQAPGSVNNALAHWSREQKDPRIGFLPCEEAVKGNSSTSSLSLDGMTPTPNGYRRLAACLAPKMAAIAQLPKAVYKTNAPSPQVSVQSDTPESHCEWVYSDWTCDVSCGEGYATRTATCVDSMTHVQMHQDCCEPLAGKSLNSYCNRGECPQVAWITGRWGTCDKKCGGGVTIRTVECINSVNEVMADDLCFSGAQTSRPSSWKRCNTSPCPLRASPNAEQEAYYNDLTGPSIKEQLGLSGSLERKDSAAAEVTEKVDLDEQRKMLLLLGDLLPASADEGGETPPVTVNSGVSIMSKKNDRDDRRSDDDDGSSSDEERSSKKERSNDDDEQTSVYTVDHTKHKGKKLSEEGASSDQGNGESYRRKTLKELLTCYRDSDCGNGYECEPFTCVKACSVYTQRQFVSPELKKRFKPTPPSFVYQGMYQAILYRGIGGLCYRKCHHMTRCNKRESDGTCKNFYCSKIEGCHDFPGDYHVPSLEECGVNGLCKPGKCRRTRGMDLRIQSADGVDRKVQAAAVDVTDPNACPGTSIPSATGCCPSGAISSSLGSCCPMGSTVDKDGECCPVSKVDACGVCGGPSKHVDILGQCCASELDANGVCCSGGRQADECGVCGGWNASCTLAVSYSIHSQSMAVLEQTVHNRFQQDMTDAAGALGFSFEDISVLNLTVDSMGEYEGPVSAAVTYEVVPSTTSKSLTKDQFRLRTAGLENELTSLERRGVCGNGLCEVGEQTRDGWEGTCPTDCSWSGFVACDCSGHGVCTAATGSCNCHKGYTGVMCAFCDEGYILVGNDADEGRAQCIPVQLLGGLSASVSREHGIWSMPAHTPGGMSMEELELAATGVPHTARSSSSDRALLAVLIGLAIFSLVMIAASLIAYIVWYRRSSSSAKDPNCSEPSKPEPSPPWNTAVEVHGPPPLPPGCRGGG